MMLKANVFTRRPIKSHVDAVVHFIQLLDDEMICDLLDAKYTYQDMSKYDFVSKLGQVFSILEEAGDDYMNASLKVNGVYDGVKVLGYSFVGNNSRYYIDLMFEIDHSGYIQDIFEYEDVEERINPLEKEARLFLEDYEYAYYDDDIDDFAEEDEDLDILN